MNNTNTGGPAFAVAELANVKWEGMTLRDYFAAKAMQAWLSTYPDDMECMLVGKPAVARFS